MAWWANLGRCLLVFGAGGEGGLGKEDTYSISLSTTFLSSSLDGSQPETTKNR
jgi:hypothetical protein